MNQSNQPIIPLSNQSATQSVIKSVNRLNYYIRTNDRGNVLMNEGISIEIISIEISMEGIRERMTE